MPTISIKLSLAFDSVIPAFSFYSRLFRHFRGLPVIGPEICQQNRSNSIGLHIQEYKSSLSAIDNWGDLILVFPNKWKKRIKEASQLQRLIQDGPSKPLPGRNMSDSIQQSGNLNTRRHNAAGGGSAAVSPALFVLFAVELFLMGSVICYYLVNRLSFPDSSTILTNIGWGLIAFVAMVWGTFYLLMSRRATLRWRIVHSRYLVAVVVGSGVVLLGILVLNIASVLVAHPVVMDIRPQFAASAGDEDTETTSAIVGDAGNGKKWFGMSCITCHGPTGDGVSNAAPSLRASEFLKTADDLAIAALIRNGRMAADPANKTGKVMPAKGGNPFLDETKIADLVALLNDLDGQFGGQASVGSASVSTNLEEGLPAGSNDEPPAIVHKWKLEELSSLEINPDEETVSIGMQAFVKAACNKCHVAAVAGQELGPTLDQIARKYPREKLLQHFVEPSAEIDEKFQSHTFLLLDGQLITGAVVSESDEKIELMTDLLKPDELNTILIEDIDDRTKSKLSPMPTGLLDVLTEEEIAGLVAYVDAVGAQMAASNAPQLNRWVVPEVSIETVPSNLATSIPATARSFSRTVAAQDSGQYSSVFRWLFVTATSVLALHFLWVIGLGTAVVMHQELQLSSGAQARVGKQLVLFWTIGAIWLILWFFIFFLIG